MHEKKSTFGYISPLPLPTGVKAEDSANAFKGYETNTVLELGGVHRDILHWATWEVGWWTIVMTYMVGFSLFSGYLAHLSTTMSFWEGFWMPASFTWTTGGIFFFLVAIFLIWVEYKAHYKRLIPQRRIVMFNRDRREVWVEDEDGKSSFIIPWEQVVIWTHSFDTLGPHGKYRNGSLMFSFKHPKTGLYLTREFGGCHPNAGLRSAELLRQWMNREIESIKDAIPYAREGDPVWQGRHSIRQYFLRTHNKPFENFNKFLSFIGFYFALIFSFGFINFRLTHRYNQKVENYLKQREVWPDDLWEWSQPIPPEERAQPSEELVRKSALMEQALAEEQDSDLPPFDRYIELAWSMRYR
ncbi:MAG: hypothetical protein LAT65_12450 [Saccharospirillum sp.]|nr:hypothetical protein [Saccharospirillum sp.]